MNILVLNGGSGSLKCSLYRLDGEAPPDPFPPLWHGEADWTHYEGRAELRIASTAGAAVQEQIEIGDPIDVFAPLLESLWSGPARMLVGREEIEVAGHRVVHGGAEFREATRVTPRVRAALAEMAGLAPVHNRFQVEIIEAVERILGLSALQVAVFDTAFHSALEPAAYVYPGPYEWLSSGIRRYGFHGISYQYTSRRAAQLLGRDPNSLRLIICHLGRGCSLAAIRYGHAVDTTMGFTPMEGLMMGSRSGSVDPGVLLHLIKHDGYTADHLDDVLNRQSGLKGVSGLSSDMRQIVEAKDRGHARAQLAFDIFVHRVRTHIGAMLAVLGGMDALVFTAGIGENSPAVRAAVSSAFEFLGLKLDADKNAHAAADTDIAAADATVRVLMIRTQENWEIARECFRLASADPAPTSD
ncbi:MAG: acetate/propionate family kinase [Acidobacteria bacterium]|nr:acetate/propionate family kinase [Acidobacteriota bacterium]